MITRMISAVFVTVTVTLTLDLALGQQQQAPQQQAPQQQAPQLGPCSLGLDGEMQIQCMQNNGVDYNGTLFIISSNRTGALPPGTTYDGFRQLMCQPSKQDLIVPCILKLMQTWNKTTCQDEDRYIMTLKGGQILGLMEGFCSEPCMAASMQTLVQCFAAVQVNPSPILNENATILTDKFAFVGNDSATAATFCNSQQRLFTCLSPLNSECPALVTRLYTLGIDLEGMERATKFLCQNVDGYVKAQECVRSDKPALVSCHSTASTTMKDILDKRYRTGMIKPSEYQTKLCETKLSKLDCQMKSMSSSCGDSTASLFSTFECTSIPNPCRNGATTKATYDGMCNKVTTPAPTVTERPTPPTKIINPTNTVGPAAPSVSGMGTVAKSVSLLLSMALMIASVFVL